MGCKQRASTHSFTLHDLRSTADSVTLMVYVMLYALLVHDFATFVFRTVQCPPGRFVSRILCSKDSLCARPMHYRTSILFPTPTCLLDKSPTWPLHLLRLCPSECVVLVRVRLHLRLLLVPRRPLWPRGKSRPISLRRPIRSNSISGLPRCILPIPSIPLCRRPSRGRAIQDSTARNAKGGSISIFLLPSSLP